MGPRTRRGKHGVVNVDTVSETLVMLYKILILGIKVPVSIKDEGSLSPCAEY